VSTSSAPTVGSQPADPISALGERILAELGEDHTNDTLTRWLCHHVARLATEADQAREQQSPRADDLARQARTAILDLWQARSAWPAGWPPPRAADITRLLESLPDSDSAGGWRARTRLSRVQDIHHQILAGLVDLAVNDGSNIEQGWLDKFGDHLTADEAMMLRRAAGQPKRAAKLLRRLTSQTSADEDQSPGDKPEPVQPGSGMHPLLALVDDYRAAITDLIQAVTVAPDDHAAARTRVSHARCDARAEQASGSRLAAGHQQGGRPPWGEDQQDPDLGPGR
jgi:hypothetical protein